MYAIKDATNIIPMVEATSSLPIDYVLVHGLYKP